MASSSSAMQTPVQYPPPVARYEQLVADANIFVDALEKFHAAMGTKFTIPIVGGKVLSICGSNFSWWLREAPLPSILMALSPAQVGVQPSPQYQAAGAQQPTTDTTGHSEALPASSPVMGVINGKFECGYLVTVTIGSETLQGVLYHVPQDQSVQVPLQSANNSGSVHAGSGTQRRRRKRKGERDPYHPKRCRTGYNFFFAEQRARMQALHPGKNRETISMIGELWNKLNDSDKTVYQELALKDQERYGIEMDEYRERLSTGRVTSNAVPLQQWPLDTDLVEVDAKGVESEEGESSRTMDNESSSGGGSGDEFDEEKDLNMEESQVVGVDRLW